MSTRLSDIRKTRKEVAKLSLSSHYNDIHTYQQKRDAVIIAFLPHASGTTKMQEQRCYRVAQEDNEAYLETVLYGDIWEELLPNERLAIEHL